MDMDTVFKKLKKSGMSAQLWDANSAAVSKHQKLQLGGNDMGDQLKDASGKGLPQGEASSSGGCAARSGGGTNDATMVLPQLTPTPEQHLPNIQQQIEQRLQTLKGKKLPPHLMGMPPAINRGGKQSGKKIGGGTKVLVPGNANNDNKKDVGTKLYQDAGGSQVKNGGIGQPPHNSALGSLNNRSQAKKDSSVRVGNQMMGGSMAPQKGGMMRPTNNMIGPASFPNMDQMGGMSMDPYTHMGGYNVQPSYGGGAVHGLGMPANSLPGDGYYPSGAGSSGSEMMQQVARNPMLQQPSIMAQPQQEHEMMMNAHSPHSQNAHYGPGCTGYQLMGYDNGHGHKQQQYPPPMYYPMPLPPKHDNIFSDENPNICSLM
ncbi:heavy metal-associated isoprenylated plant protein 32-like [Miscanthus floridulus]|uniref:heavy metal-associated isoprenylated plant protein 32-like n=1 Tax=Miscanthus floridulus TaxID=154761 RepID=UPI0034589530